MRLVILGGGGFRVPLVHGALLRDTADRRVTEVVLHDTDAARLDVIADVLSLRPLGTPARRPAAVGHGDDRPRHGAARAPTSSSRRCGSAGSRAAPPTSGSRSTSGVLGQETTGPGGVGYGAAHRAGGARRRRTRTPSGSPDAWVINFTNPAGLVTQAMQSVLGDRVVGICDSPMGLARKRAAGALGHDLDDLEIDYAGLNHLGWLRGLRRRRPRPAPRPARRRRRPRRHRGGPALRHRVAARRSAPCPTSTSTTTTSPARRSPQILGAPQTRGEFLVGQQADFYAGGGRRPRAGLAAVGRACDASATRPTCRRPARATTGAQERAEADVEGGGYEGVALALMAAIARDEPARLILNVRNGGAVAGLPDDAVVEVPCRVDAARPGRRHREPARRATRSGSMQQVKAVDEPSSGRPSTRSADAALRAFALHPLVDSVTDRAATARRVPRGLPRGRRPPLLTEVGRRRRNGSVDRPDPAHEDRAEHADGGRQRCRGPGSRGRARARRRRGPGRAPGAARWRC